MRYNTETTTVDIKCNDYHQAVNRMIESLTDLITPLIQLDQSTSDDDIHQKIIEFLQDNY